MLACRGGGCAAGDLFLCSSCDASQHSLHHIHQRGKLDESTLGFKPLQPGPATFALPACTICKASFMKDGSCSPISTKTVLLQTLTAGETEVQVVSLKCNVCMSNVGSSASEYRCVPGGSNQWATQDLIDCQTRMYDGSRFKLTTSALAAAHEDTCSQRGGSCVGSRGRAAAIGRAFRMSSALKAREDLGGDVDLEACQACDECVHSMHYDGCFKLRNRQDTGNAHGAPLAPSLFSPEWDADKNELLLNPEMRAFRKWRHGAMKVPKGKERAEESPCPPMASTSSTKAASRKHKFTGVHAGVCRHNMLCTSTACLIDTVSRPTLLNTIVDARAHPNDCRSVCSLVKEWSIFTTQQGMWCSMLKRIARTELS